MKFDNMRFILAHTIAKNEGAENPMRLAMLSAMLDISMPVSLMMTQKLARRDVAGQPVTTAETTAAPAAPAASEINPNDLVGYDYQYAVGFINALGPLVNSKTADVIDDTKHPGKVIKVNIIDQNNVEVLYNPGTKMPNLFDKTATCAKCLLEAAGLSERQDDDWPDAGRVTGQSPPAGNAVNSLSQTSYETDADAATPDES